MARFKDFGAGKDNNASAEPISFKLHGEDFDCIPRLQGKTLLEFVELANSENAGDSAKVTRTFFSKVMTDATYERFNALLDDKEKIVTVETLSEIIGWLIEEYSDRPNQQPEA
jgi:hypothetical protein